MNDTLACEIDRAAAALGGNAAIAAMRRDPYWPKWAAPWWDMTVLWELGHADRIPERAAQAMVDALNGHYLRFFPKTMDDIPAGADPYRHIACHCALGTMGQVLGAVGVPVFDAVPWLLDWMLEHQLPDGGLNCDEQAYTAAHPHSSVVSTLPAAPGALWPAARLGGRGSYERTTNGCLSRETIASIQMNLYHYG